MPMAISVGRFVKRLGNGVASSPKPASANNHFPNRPCQNFRRRFACLSVRLSDCQPAKAATSAEVVVITKGHSDEIGNAAAKLTAETPNAPYAIRRRMR